MTMVELPSGPGYSGAFVLGLRSLGDTNATERAGAVIVRRAFTISGGVLGADRAVEPINMADTIQIVDSTPWVTLENDLAVTKRHGDLIVLGGRAPGRGGTVAIDGAARLRRGAGDDGDFDLAANLFGWHPRTDPPRKDDARMLAGGPPAAGDRLDRFNNAQRRATGSVSLALAAPLPGQGIVRITHSKIAPETEDPVLLSFSYTMPALSLTLYLHEGRGPDREPRWCPHDQGAMTFDTLVVRPAAGTAAALWRKSWPWGAPGADTLRRAVVSEGGA
ncbi:MAG TPA: hypothetical protein VF620_12355 [Allosphingosinicella sp.]|jgi:hypothetical protein